MRNTILASAAILSLSFAPSLAQQEQWAHQPGTGESGPASDSASNINQADTHSSIAPHFPSPDIGPNAAPFRYLKAAEAALNRHHTGEADQALEMAETRILDRSTPAGSESMPDHNLMVAQISSARQALGHNDIDGARRAIAVALSESPMARRNAEMGGMQPAGGMGMQPGGMAPAYPPQGGGMGMQPTNMAPTGAPGMAPSGAGAAPGASAGATVGGGAMGTGTTDSAGGAR